ncbi:PDR/VanB family oxidoreductase [Alkalihalobacillus sp. BA299]|uniref:PDR/VanB family oxidoreductase n=1 Tax=Alkalihalobacillus sp. BA299 TaxID=2815938 RepID=UPI001ADA09FD|nr:PDR/VanB family oxidoreductase [Alkalihalobacillus sp. BA299]
MEVNTLNVAIDEIKQITPVVKSFSFASLDGLPLPKFSGGSHITTYVQNEKDTYVRHYSLINSPDKTGRYHIAIRRNDQSKGGSMYWHDQMKIGDELQISYPKNHFMLSFSAKHHVFFAAGIGITPFLSMMSDLKSKRKSFELHYAAPSKELCAFYEYLNLHFLEETKFYFSKHNQRLNTQFMKFQQVGTHVYFCGPERFIQQFANDARRYGYPEHNIHYELFSEPDFGPKHSFRVTLNKSKKELIVPEEKSLLDTLLDNGIKAPYSCRIGGCGSCLLNVVRGEIDHRDLFLTKNEKKEQNVILSCVSRGKSNDLVLDL